MSASLQTAKTYAIQDGSPKLNNEENIYLVKRRLKNNNWSNVNDVVQVQVKTYDYQIQVIVEETTSNTLLEQAIQCRQFLRDAKKECRNLKQWMEYKQIARDIFGAISYYRHTTQEEQFTAMMQVQSNPMAEIISAEEEMRKLEQMIAARVAIDNCDRTITISPEKLYVAFKRKTNGVKVPDMDKDTLIKAMEIVLKGTYEYKNAPDPDYEANSAAFFASLK